MREIVNISEYSKKMRNYYDSEGKLIQYPTKKPLRMIALVRIAECFENGKKYSEKEVNEIIKSKIAFSDIELIRREMFQYKMLGRLRDGSEYWAEPEWRKIYGEYLGKTNYFIEGLQGAGKSTLLQRLSEKYQDYEVFREGDYSPVELAWCAYVTEEQYAGVLSRYESLKNEIVKKTVDEGEHRVICYTQILTDVQGFHKDLEQYEIYNGNLNRETFEHIVLSRFQKWNETGQIFECSIFQNIIENQLLYLMMTDDEILDFYKRLKTVLSGKPFQIIYLDVDDIREGIEIIRRERSDDKGNELWFPLMMKYLEESPYGKKNSLCDMDGLVAHLERRKALEHRIMNEVFREESVILKAKNYNLDEI